MKFESFQSVAKDHATNSKLSIYFFFQFALDLNFSSLGQKSIYFAYELSHYFLSILCRSNSSIHFTKFSFSIPS